MSMIEQLLDLMSESASLRHKTITVYADQAAVDELKELVARFEELEGDNAPKMITAKSPLRELEVAWNDAKERYDASRAEIKVVRLTDTIRKQIERENPAPKPPRKLGKGATKAQQEAFDEATAVAWREAAEVLALTERSVLMYSIERFEFRGETVERQLDDAGEVTTPVFNAEQIEALFKMPYGEQWKNLITDAINEVSALSDEPDVPFSRANSGNAPA